MKGPLVTRLIRAVNHLFRKRYWLCNDSFFGLHRWVVVSRMPWEPYYFDTLPVTVRPLVAIGPLADRPRDL